MLTLKCTAVHLELTESLDETDDTRDVAVAHFSSEFPVLPTSTQITLTGPARDVMQFKVGEGYTLLGTAKTSTVFPGTLIRGADTVVGSSTSQY